MFHNLFVSICCYLIFYRNEDISLENVSLNLNDYLND